MSIIANKIANKINLDTKMKHHSYDQTKRLYVDRVHKIEILGIPLKVKLTEEAY